MDLEQISSSCMLEQKMTVTWIFHTLETRISAWNRMFLSYSTRGVRRLIVTFLRQV
jgi:hypothetical protein